VGTAIYQQAAAEQQRQKGETGGAEKEQAGPSGDRVVDSKDFKVK
jgi:hypothetical protein